MMTATTTTATTMTTTMTTTTTTTTTTMTTTMTTMRVGSAGPKVNHLGTERRRRWGKKEH